MDSDFTMVMLRSLGPIASIAPFLMWMAFSGPVLIYPIARWRAQREPVADQHLGIKVALGYFAMLAFQLALFGVALVLFGVLSKSPPEDRGELYRIGFGFAVPGSIMFVAHLALLRRTNQDQFPSVRRLWLGYNVVVTGLLGLIAFVATCQALFSKGSSGDVGRFCAAALVVYGSAWAACGIQLGRLVLGPYMPTAPQDIVTPPSEPDQPAGPTLPPLGGGAFPPIDPKR